MNQELVYEGRTIRLTGEMLSLTDMWKAAGSPANQAPAQWLRSAAATNFTQTVAVIVGNSHDKLVDTKKRGGTTAHWQIGLA